MQNLWVWRNRVSRRGSGGRPDMVTFGATQSCGAGYLPIPTTITSVPWPARGKTLGWMAIAISPHLHYYNYWVHWYSGHCRKARSRRLLINPSPPLGRAETAEQPHFSAQGNGHREGPKSQSLNQVEAESGLELGAFFQPLITSPGVDAAREAPSDWKNKQWIAAGRKWWWILSRVGDEQESHGEKKKSRCPWDTEREAEGLGHHPKESGA